jgi:hypothetical protein
MMQEHSKKWKDDDFDGMSWHDNHVRSVRISNPRENYDYDLILDLDYILEWIHRGGTFDYRIAPAILIFHIVDNVKFDFQLYFKDDIEISSIERQDITPEPEKKLGLRKWHFTIHLQVKDGSISFDARSFEQELRREPRVVDRQLLDETERSSEQTSSGDVANRTVPAK